MACAPFAAFAFAACGIGSVPFTGDTPAEESTAVTNTPPATSTGQASPVVGFDPTQNAPVIDDSPPPPPEVADAGDTHDSGGPTDAGGPPAQPDAADAGPVGDAEGTEGAPPPGDATIPDDTGIAGDDAHIEPDDAGPQAPDTGIPDAGAAPLDAGIPPFCFLSRDCPEGFLCINSKCIGDQRRDAGLLLDGGLDTDAGPPGGTDGGGIDGGTPDAGVITGCRTFGAVCDANSPCCTGLSCFKGLCSGCKLPGTSCISASQCCGGLQCANNLCTDCKPSGTACTQASECCAPTTCDKGECRTCANEGGSCVDTIGCCGSLECVAGICTNCRRISEACGSGNLCCSPLQCENSVCTGCAPQGQSCNSTNDCCGGLNCSSHICKNCKLTNGACTSKTDCCDGLECSKSKCAVCQAAGKTCAQASDCCNDMECVNSQCSLCQKLDATCAQTSECCPNLNCFGAKCVSCKITNQTCATSTDCCTGLSCFNGKCKAHCENDFDCSPKVCVSEICETKAPTGATGCVILTLPGVIKEGLTKLYTAAAVNSSGTQLPGGTFKWESAAPAIVSFADPFNGLATGGAAGGSTTIKARLIGTTKYCPEVAVTNFPAPGAGKIRVIARDITTHSPVAGASAVIGAGAPVLTDADGAAELTGTPPQNISVYAGGYDYITVAQFDKTDLLLFLQPKHLSGDQGSASGTLSFTGVSSSGDVDLGIYGISPFGDAASIDFGALAGENIDTTVTYYPPIPFAQPLSFTVPLPEGMYAYSDSRIKINKTTCKSYGTDGLHAAWSLYGRAASADIEDDFLDLYNQYGTSIPESEIAIVFTKYLRKLSDHGMVDSVTLPKGGNKTQNQSRAQTYDKSITVKVPQLPTATGASFPGAQFSVSAPHPSRGLVGMGLSIGSDKNGDRIIDALDGTPAGSMFTKYRSPYQIVSGLPLFMSVAAVGDTADAALALSMFFQQASSLATSVDLSGSSFMGLSSGTTYNRATRVLTPGAVVGANVYRAVFDVNDHHWFVYLPSTTSTFTLPTPPVPFTDLTTSAMVMHAIEIKAPATLFSILEFSNTNLDELYTVATRVSAVRCLTSGGQPHCVIVP